MPVVGAVGIKLALQAQPVKRLVGAAVRRIAAAAQVIARVELHAGVGGVGFHNAAGGFVPERAQGIGLRGFVIKYIVVVQAAAVHGFRHCIAIKTLVAYGHYLPCRDVIRRAFQHLLCPDAEPVVVDGFGTFGKVKIGVVGEVKVRRCIGNRMIINYKFIIVCPPVCSSGFDISGETAIATGTAQREGNGIFSSGKIPHFVVPSRAAAVVIIARAVVFVEVVHPAVYLKTGVGNTVGERPHGYTYITVV